MNISLKKDKIWNKIENVLRFTVDVRDSTRRAVTVQPSHLLRYEIKYEPTNPGVWLHCWDGAIAYCKAFSRAHNNTLNHAANSLSPSLSLSLSLKQRKPKPHQDYFQRTSLNTTLSQFYPPSPNNIYLQSRLSPSRSHRRMFHKSSTNQTVTWWKTESGFKISVSQLTVKLVSFRVTTNLVTCFGN